MSTFINRSRLMLESGLSHRCSSSYIGSDRCSLSYSDRCLSVRWNRLRLKHPISDTLLLSSSSSSLSSSSSSSSSSLLAYYAGNSVVRSTSRYHYVLSRHLSIEKDNNKIRKDEDDDDAVNDAHKLMKDIGSNSSSSNITTNDGINNSNSSSGSNNSNSRFDDKSSLNTLADNGDQPIQQTLSSNDEAVVSTQSLSDSSSALSPLDTPVSSSSSPSTSSSSSPSSSSSSPSATTASSSTEPVEEIPLHNQVINPKNVTTIGSTIHYAEQKYEDFEANLMKSINESNQRRFRFLLIGTLLSIIWISTVFGARIRKMLTEETAGLAKETLENESLKIQTQELAMAVVQTILNDKEITAHAAAFLKEASTAPETQQALLKLTLHILQHKDTLKELTILSKRLLSNLTNDQEIIKELSALFVKVVEDKDLKNALVIVVFDLCQDPVVFQAIMELVMKVIVRADVVEATQSLLSEATSEVMKEEQIMDQSRKFVADVMGDDLLQQEGGNALMKSVTYALQPGLIRITGFTLAVASIALAKIVLSPY